MDEKAKNGIVEISGWTGEKNKKKKQLDWYLWKPARSFQKQLGRHRERESERRKGGDWTRDKNKGNGKQEMK